jgi:hypothetical protein
MKLLVGLVVENAAVDLDGNGTVADGYFYAKFGDRYEDNRSVPVLYTSPYYKGNAGGMVAIPEVGTQIIAALNEDPEPGEANLYFIACTPNIPQASKEEEVNENYEAIRSNDSKYPIYGETYKPITQCLTNTDGAGLLISKEHTNDKINNSVVLKCTKGAEVSVGPLGVHIKNSDGDSIVLNDNTNTADQSGGPYAARSAIVETRGPQMYKCVASDINMKIVDGGDINIENNSTGLFSLPPWFGNIRLKSRFRDITLAALGPTSKIHIVTNGTQVIVDSLGGVKIVTAGSIDFAAAQDINMTAGGSVNIVGNLGAQVGSIGGAAQLNAPTVFINNQAFAFNAGPPGSDFTNNIPVVGSPATPPVPPIITPNDYGDPVGGAV